MIKAGSYLDASDFDGNTALKCAAVNGYPSIAKRLVEAGASVDNPPHCKGETPLCLAVRYNKYETAKYLLSVGANVNARGTRGKTPLDLSRSLAMSGLLKSYGGASAPQSTYKSTSKPVSINPLCSACGGGGTIGLGIHKKRCGNCKGTGWTHERCPACKNLFGEVFGGKKVTGCSKCGFTGYIRL